MKTLLHKAKSKQHLLKAMNNLWAASFDAARFPMKGICYFMVIMSVDYGDVRTGVAFCDKSEILASPFTVIKETYLPKLASKLCNIAAEKRRKNRGRLAR